MADDLPNGRRLFIGPDLILRTVSGEERKLTLGAKLCVKVRGELVVEIQHTGPDTLRDALAEAVQIYGYIGGAEGIEAVARYYEEPDAG